jgi:hypothetical protein
LIIVLARSSAWVLISSAVQFLDAPRQGMVYCGGQCAVSSSLV